MQCAPLLFPAIGFLAGIVADAYACDIAAAAFALLFAFVRREVAIGLLCGIAIGLVHGHPACVTAESRTARFAGTVVGDVRSEGEGISFPFALDSGTMLRAHGVVRAAAGERLLVRGRVEPLDEPRNPGEPSAREIGLDEGIAGELAVGGIIARAPPDLHDPRVWMPLARAWASRIVHAALPEPQAGILAGALWGERGALPTEVRDDFQATGTVHVLVTAGLHLGVVAALCATLTLALSLPRVVAALGTIPLVYAYAWFSGWHLPSQRAAAMIAVALLARACGARIVSLNTLAIAAIVVAATWPVAVTSISFALSFSCVTAIVLFAEPLAVALRTMHVPERASEPLALTVATQIGVWPLTAATFFVVAPYAALANVIVVPLVGVAMTMGFGMLAIHAFAPLAAVVAQWEMWVLTIVLMVTHNVASLPGARMTMTPPPPWAIAGYDGAAVLAAVLVRTQFPRIAAVLLSMASIALAIVPNISLPHALTITGIDVGQGDGILVRTPHDHVIMFDTGGRLERGPDVDGRSPAEASAARVVVPYLRRAGIRSIDVMILTHPHGDHVGGCLPILQSFDVREILDSGQVYSGRAYQDCLREARSLHVPVHVTHRGERFALDGATVDILAPSLPFFADGNNDVNENSIVARLRYGSFTAFFTGDAGAQSETRILASGDDIRSTLLKVGHHGSAYSSTPAFIAAVHPRYAMISVGRHNLFGHPAPSTLTTLKRVGATILRTDRCGAVTITVDTQSHAQTMLPCEAE
jgi:competence protein ComEC